MSAATKQQAHEKLNTFRIKIGYPDEWRNYDGLEIDEKLSFFENLRRAAEFDHAYEIARRVNKPVDRNEWYMTPQTINAYYDPHDERKSASPPASCKRRSLTPQPMMPPTTARSVS